MPGRWRPHSNRERKTTSVLPRRRMVGGLVVGLKHSYLTAITYKECGNNIMSDACRMILNFE